MLDERATATITADKAVNRVNDGANTSTVPAGAAATCIGRAENLKSLDRKYKKFSSKQEDGFKWGSLLVA